MNFLFKSSGWQLAIISGTFVGVSYHPLHLGFLAYVGFIPLFHTWLNQNPKKNFLTGYLFGIVYNMISNYWIAANSGAEFLVVLSSLIAAVLYLSIFWGIAGLIIGAFNKNHNSYLMLPFSFSFFFPWRLWIPVSETNSRAVLRRN